MSLSMDKKVSINQIKAYAEDKLGQKLYLNDAPNLVTLVTEPQTEISIYDTDDDENELNFIDKNGVIQDSSKVVMVAFREGDIDYDNNFYVQGILNGCLSISNNSTYTLEDVKKMLSYPI